MDCSPHTTKEEVIKCNRSEPFEPVDKGPSWPLQLSLLAPKSDHSPDGPQSFFRHGTCFCVCSQFFVTKCWEYLERRETYDFQIGKIVKRHSDQLFNLLFLPKPCPLPNAVDVKQTSFSVAHSTAFSIPLQRLGVICLEELFPREVVSSSGQEKTLHIYYYFLCWFLSLPLSCH